MTKGVVRRAARAGGALALIILFVAVGRPASSDISAFTVTGIEVDQTAASAAQAREAAISEGQRKGLQRLFERLVPADQRSRLPSLSNAQIADLVQSFEVASERASTVRYIGTLTFRYRPDDVRTLLRNAGIAFSEQTARPLVVLPVLRQESRALLWEDDNGWRRAWSEAAHADGLVPLIAPLGDLADIGTISAEQALQGDASRVGQIAARYDAGGVLVPYAQYEASATPSLRVNVTRAGDGAIEALFSETIAARPGEGVDALMRRAAGDIARLVQSRWTSATVLQFDRANRLTAVVPLGSLADWVRIRKGLGEIAAVRKTELLRLGRVEALIELDFVGDERQLQVALAQRDLTLLSVAGEAPWELRLGRGATLGRGRPAAPNPSPAPAAAAEPQPPPGPAVVPHEPAAAPTSTLPSAPPTKP